MVHVEIALAFADRVTTTDYPEPRPASIPSTNLQGIIQDQIASTVVPSLSTGSKVPSPEYPPAASNSAVTSAARYPDVAFHASQVTSFTPLTQYGFQRPPHY